MRKILAGMILCLGLALFTNSARAESNPLLTIFEGIQTRHIPSGIKGTLVDSVIEAAQTYAELASSGLDTGYNPEVTVQLKKQREDGTTIMIWDWKNKKFARGNNINPSISPPSSMLEIIVENDRVIRAKYTYVFLDLKFELFK